jgi:hypothetical protein
VSEAELVYPEQSDTGSRSMFFGTRSPGKGHQHRIVTETDGSRSNELHSREAYQHGGQCLDLMALHSLTISVSFSRKLEQPRRDRKVKTLEMTGYLSPKD